MQYKLGHVQNSHSPLLLQVSSASVQLSSPLTKGYLWSDIPLDSAHATEARGLPATEEYFRFPSAATKATTRNFPMTRQPLIIQSAQIQELEDWMSTSFI